VVEDAELGEGERNEDRNRTEDLDDLQHEVATCPWSGSYLPLSRHFPLSIIFQTTRGTTPARP
jgi:hypothetical protein